MEAFPDLVRLDRPLLDISYETINPNWLIGFIVGDGSFTAIPYGGSFRVRFYITQHNRDLKLLDAINKKYFSDSAGKLQKNGLTAVNLAIESYKNCLKYIIPFISKYPIPSNSFKYSNYKIWEEILLIMDNKGHRTSEGKSQIKSLISRLNKYD